MIKINPPPKPIKKEQDMRDNIITATKMICKSIDALAREIYLLRTAENKGLETNVDGRSIKECCGSPPTHDTHNPGRLTG